jgi:hypothetical protein
MQRRMDCPQFGLVQYFANVMQVLEQNRKYFPGLLTGGFQSVSFSDV